MNENKIKFLRIALTISGIFLLLLGAFEIYKLFTKTLVNTFSFNVTIYETGSFMTALIYASIGYILTNIGIFYKSFFKHLSKAIIGISVFFMTTGFLLIAIDNNSQNTIESIQPSIDILLVSSLDTIVDEMVTIKNGELLDIIISENSVIEKYNNWELTSEQTDFFMKQFNIENISETKKIYLSRLLITMISDELEKSPQLNSDVAIPISEIKKQIDESGVDLEVLKSIDESLMTQFYPVNINAYITLQISDNDITKTISIGQSSKEEINEIWEQLGLNDSISIETKTLVVNSVLSLIKDQLEQTTNSNQIPSIPLSTLKTIIPSEIFDLLKIDLFNPDMTIRANELKNLRTQCENLNSSQMKEIDEICENIKITTYDYFLTNIENLSKLSNLEIPQIYLTEIEKVNTLDKLNTKLTQITSFKTLSIIIAILILICSSACYIIHNKINKIDSNPIKNTYTILKYNTINFCISFVFLILGYLLISSDKFFEIIISYAPQDTISTINIFQSLPIFMEVLNILYDVVIYSFRYVILLVLLLVIFKKIDGKYFENRIEKFE